ncbi:MAG: xanthine dehydrogenase family protein molybdopterin-binding subunit [Acidimicrobiia bacterium]|nr:xanthine dehydrogenase family protein molybdopterin-binding subunit [Acidimicrobiia bacterium]
MSAGRFIGQRILRREDRRLTAGRGTYIANMGVPGMLHARFVRSSVARGVIRSIDARAAKAQPGVVEVLTAAELNRLAGPMFAALIGDQVPYPPLRALADGDVRYVGEPIAVVVADSPYAAWDAADLVEMDIEPQIPVIGAQAALDNAAELVHPERNSNVAQSMPSTDPPDLDAAFESAAHVVTRTFTQSRATNAPMEPRGIIASWTPFADTLEAWVSSQNPHEYHVHFANLLGIANHQVHVRMGDIGGGFGQKMMVTRDEDCIVLASRHLGRPIKWIEDRSENLTAANQARAEVLEVSMALDDQARILGCRVRHVEDVGAYAVGGHSSASGNLARFFPGPYRVPLYGFASQSAYTNTVGRAAYRGPWLSETTAREQMMDHVARELGIDPLDLRRRNTVTADELPYTTATGMVYENVSLRECLDQAAEMVDYDEFRQRQQEARQEGRYIGLGISSYVEPSGMAWASLATEQVSLRIDPGGKVRIFMGSGDHGQSLATTMSQLVAEHLGCALDDIEFMQGDTAATPFGAGTGGSRSAVIGGGAAIGAARQLHDKVVEIAAHHLEAAPPDIEVRDGVASVVGTPARQVTLAEIAGMAYRSTDLLPPGMEPGLEASHRYQPPNVFTFSNATHICICEVDIETGLVSLERFVVSEDCGRMINPMVVDGQIAGGVVQGIGGVLWENMAYDDQGSPLASTFMDYLIPSAPELPPIECGHIETPSNTEGGFKGMGEGGTIGAPAAVANAVADALAPLGVQVDTFPLGPREVFELIRSARR